MNTIWIVSTELKHGKGGISTALVGFLESFDKSNIKYKLIKSHSATNKFKLWLRALWSMRNVDKSDVVWLHCGNWLSIFRKITIAMIAKLCKATVIFHYHDAMDDALGNFHYKLLVKISIMLSDKVVFITKHGEDLLIKYNISASNKVEILPNPYDSMCKSNLAFTRTFKLGNEVKILAMTRIEDGKGIDDVIDTARLFPNNYKLIIAGDGSKLGTMKERANGIKNINFLGWVDYEKKSELLRDADIFFLPSKFDSFGMVYLEAMSAGLPIVALNTRAVPYVVDNGTAGILVDNAQPELYFNAIKRIESNYSYYSDNAKYIVESKYEPDMLVMKFLNIIKSVQ